MVVVPLIQVLLVKVPVWSRVPFVLVRVSPLASPRYVPASMNLAYENLAPTVFRDVVELEGPLSRVSS